MTLRRLATTLLFAVLALPALPAQVHAQQCGLGRGHVAAAGGVSHYDVAGGTAATEVGGDVGLRAAGVTLRAGYRRILPETGAADPDAARLSVGVPVTTLAGVGLCAVGHAGGTRFAADGDEEATVVAGGVGLRIERPLAFGRVLPFVEVRGLGASMSGRVLGLDVDASGLSLGAEAGVEAGLGAVLVRATVALDGFDGGLGITPYPTRLFALALGVRF